MPGFSLVKNMMNLVLSESGFVVISKIRLHPTRKRKTEIGKHMGSTKLTVLPSLFLFSVNRFIECILILEKHRDNINWII